MCRGSISEHKTLCRRCTNVVFAWIAEPFDLDRTIEIAMVAAKSIIKLIKHLIHIIKHTKHVLYLILTTQYRYFS